jgi:hypothetical protein
VTGARRRNAARALTHPRSFILIATFFGVTSFLAVAGCGGGSSSSAVPASQSDARVRFAEGAPELETIIASTPEPISSPYLQVDGQTKVSLFNYGTFSPFMKLPPGTHSLVARDADGYAVGPLMTPSLSAGTSYTLIVVGSYPTYSVLAFTEPASNGNAQLSLYEASPSVPQTGFGSFVASTGGGFKQLGSAKYGSLVTVNLGKRVVNFGGYAGPSPSKIVGKFTPSQLNSFDSKNVLPFHSISRLSLFLFDASSTAGPLFGSLDQ